jgi:hypothetical protein
MRCTGRVSMWGDEMEKTNVHLAGSQEYAPAAPRSSGDEAVRLLPCPFCGHEPWGVFGPHTDLGSCWVECHADASGNLCGDWHYTADGDMREARAATTAAWNRRAAPEPNQPEQHQPEQQAEGRS